MIESTGVIVSNEKNARFGGHAGALVAHAPSPSVTWMHLLILAVAFAALFWTNLERLWQWTNPSSGDANWGHAFFIPLISLAYLLEHRDRLKNALVRPAATGLVFVALGLALFVGGIGVGANFAQFGPYLQDLGMLTTLFGAVLSVFGWRILRITLFPIAYLLCALPWPPYVHDTLTLPLQHVAATASVRVLQWTGMNVEQAGNTLHILSTNGVDRALNVAEACSGMRSLITFLALGLAVAFLSNRPFWQKIVISLSAVPIAILCNIFRIVGEGLLDQYVSQSLSQGFAHSAVGLVLLAPGFALFLLVGWILDRLTRRRPKRGAHMSPKSTPSSDRARGIAFGRMYFAVLSILLVAAVSFAVAGHVLQLQFVKVPVPLTRPLTQVPAELGPWRLYGGNQSIPDDLEQTLGATQYVFREYLDSRVIGDQAIDALQHNPSEANGLLADIAASHPQALVRIAVTYYTGHVDAVIHQSERCNLAGGIATSIESHPEKWTLGPRCLNVRVVHLMQNSAEEKGPHYLAYCYCVNGRQETEAWRVRSLLMNIFERQAWYAKIEVTSGLADPNESQRVLSDFLENALPEIEKCFPVMQAASSENRESEK